VGFLDTLLGRTKPVPPNLDELFALPTAALTLEAGTDFTPTGSGSVCFRAAEGKAFSDIEKDVQELLSMGKDSAPVQVSTDQYHFTWLVAKHSPDDPEGLVTDLHAVNSSLESGGFGPQLLSGWCTCTSGAPSTRSPRWRDSSVTTPWNCRSAVCSALTSRSSLTSAAGCRSGARRACNGGTGPHGRCQAGRRGPVPGRPVPGGHGRASIRSRAVLACTALCSSTLIWLTS
jgi:hypothetical protein